MIYVAAFIGGPFFGAYLMAENLRVFGQSRSSWFTWIAAILFTALFAFCCSLENSFIEKIPNFVIPVIYSTIYMFLAKQYQGRQIDEYFEAGSSKWPI